MIEGVFNEKVKREERLYFKLEEWNGSEVIIKVVNENGDEIDAPFICTIDKKTGKVCREHGVNNTIGFDLDNYGRVKVE